MAFQVERFQVLRWKPKNIRSSWKVLRNRLELLILSLFLYHFFEGGGERVMLCYSDFCKFLNYPFLTRAMSDTTLEYFNFKRNL